MRKFAAEHNQEHLLDYFDGRTIQKGEQYFSSGMVISFELDKDSDLNGRVRGSGLNVYDAIVAFDAEDGSISYTFCSCPVARDCKHTVALFLAYLNDNPTRWEEDDDLYPSIRRSKKTNVEKNSAAPDPSPGLGQPVESAGGLTGETGRRVEVPGGLPRDIARSLDRVAAMRGSLESPGEIRESTSNILIYRIPESHWSTTPIIDLLNVALRKDGSYGQASIASLDAIARGRVPKYVSSTDLEITKFWCNISGFESYYSSRNELGDDPDLFAALMKRILSTGRCHFGDHLKPALSLGPELPGILSWTLNRTGEFVLSALAQRGDETIECVRWKCPWYIDTKNNLCGPVKLKLQPAVLDGILTMPAISAEQLSLMPALLAARGLTDLIPDPLGDGPVEIRYILPRAALSIETLPCKSSIHDAAGVVATAGQLTKVAVMHQAFERPDGYFWKDGDNTIVERHNLHGHAELLQQLLALGFIEASPADFGRDRYAGRFFIYGNGAEWVTFAQEHVDNLRRQGWHISQDSAAQLRVIELDEKDMRFEVTEDGGADWWFSLELNIVIDGEGQPLLPILVSAIRRMTGFGEITIEAIDALNRQGRFFTALANGNMITLPFERIRAILIALKEYLDRDDLRKLKVSVLHALQLDETLSKSRWIGGERIKAFIEKLRRFGLRDKIKLPPEFRAQLRSYQEEGLAWLQMIAADNFGGILADDMGLGKTVQLLAHMCVEKEHKRSKTPFLVVCPTSVLPNWISEARRFAPHLKVLPLTGTERNRHYEDIAKYDLVVTSYALIVRDLEVLSQIHWHGVILDEAQYIKNPDTKVAYAARSLKSNHRVCATGTPIQNHLGELWSQFQFLMPGLLGDKATFKTCIRDPIEKGNDVLMQSTLAARIRPFLLRRTKGEVDLQLPDKTEMIQMVQIEGPQRDLYETVRLASTKRIQDEVAYKGFKQSQIIILDALLKLRQTCCHPNLVKLDAARKVTKSAKLDRLIEMLALLTEEGRKILLFSQFTSMLELIKIELWRNNLGFVELTGITKDRATPVKQFQEGNVPIFLISLKAGGTGLNLTAADTVIHYDPWWNPAVEEQATDRAHRIGQTKNVFVYKLIAKGTIEERMIQLQDRKRKLANGILDETGNLSKSFTEDDLQLLLGPIQD